MRKWIEENERVKRRYLAYLKGPKGRDEKTVNMVAAAILKFERSTNFKSFKKFHIEQATKFKLYLETAKNPRTKKPLSHATIDATLRKVKDFFFWLAGQSGYKSRINYPDTEYFNNSLKGARIAHASRPIPYPSLEQCTRAFEGMPEPTEEQRRDKAAFAFFMLTGGRVTAVSSIRLRHINLEDGSVFQDARDVKTKNGKTFTSWFFPVDSVYLAFFTEWVEYLKHEQLFGPEDAVFPKPHIALGAGGGFANLGLSRECYTSSAKFNKVLKASFQMVQMPAYTPHSLRKTLTLLMNEKCKTPEQVKAWSMNYGHESVTTTLTSYLPMSVERQGQVMKEMGKHTQV